MSNEIVSKGRRKAVKTIVGGVTALAAYNVLPAKWGVPVVEQILLPAHAATSGPANYTNAAGGGASIEAENNFMEMLADAGEAVSNFIVSEAHADVRPASNDDWYISVVGETVTIEVLHEGDTCLVGTTTLLVNSVAEMKRRANGSLYRYATIVESTANQIIISVKNGEDTSFGQVTCTRSSTSVPTCVEPDRK